MQEKNLVLVGASAGIGRALALEYASMGYRLILASRDLAALEALCSRIGPQAIAQCCDATNISDWRLLAAKSEEQFGTIDLLIVNSGISIPNTMNDFSSENVIKTFDVNTFGLARALEVFVPIFRKAGSGTIVSVGSLADCRGIPRSGTYNASKAALAQLLESARIELHGEGIRVVTVKPGFVRTAMTAGHKYKMPFIINPEMAAKIIADGIDRGKNRIYFPTIMALAAWAARVVPDGLYEWAFRRWKG